MNDNGAPNTTADKPSSQRILEELPAGVLPDGKKTPAGRQSYHGKSELIASNHSEFTLVWLRRS
jgi:hypothetical protein